MHYWCGNAEHLRPNLNLKRTRGQLFEALPKVDYCRVIGSTISCRSNGSKDNATLKCEVRCLKSGQPCSLQQQCAQNLQMSAPSLPASPLLPHDSLDQASFQLCETRHDQLFPAACLLLLTTVSSIEAKMRPLSVNRGDLSRHRLALP